MTYPVGPSITPGELVLRIALDENGVREDPPGSNRGQRVDQYLRAVGLDPEGGSYPWCAAFVSWCMLEVALRLGPGHFRGSASVEGLHIHNPELQVPVDGTVWPGDIFLHFGEGGHGNHCGFVTRANPDGSLATLEGNTDRAGSRTGGQVMHQHRPPGYASVFLRPA